MRRLFYLVAAVVALFFINNPVNAQPSNENEESFKKERRVFLWDVTISMVGATRYPTDGDLECPTGHKRTSPDYTYNEGVYTHYNKRKDIFDETRDKLIKMIYQIQNESTQIIVLPFRDKIVGRFEADATADGKEQLKKQIMQWNRLCAGGTYTATCLRQAVDENFAKDRTNRLFLLTDGEPTVTKDAQGKIVVDELSPLLSYLKNWKGYTEATKGESSYLVYIMLTDEANNQNIIDIAKDSDKVDVIETFEEPVCLSLKHAINIYVRDYFNGKHATDGKGSMEIPFSYITGNSIPENSIFHFDIETNDYIEVDSSTPIRPSDGKFSVPFRFKKEFQTCLTELPQEYNMTIQGTCKKDAAANKNITLVGSPAVNISLVIKSEPRVKISWSTKKEEN